MKTDNFIEDEIKYKILFCDDEDNDEDEDYDDYGDWWRDDGHDDDAPNTDRW